MISTLQFRLAMQTKRYRRKGWYSVFCTRLIGLAEIKDPQVGLSVQKPLPDTLWSPVCLTHLHNVTFWYGFECDNVPLFRRQVSMGLRIGKKNSTCGLAGSLPHCGNDIGSVWGKY